MLLLLALLSLARADVVDDPPADCPPGARGETAHSGTWCEATTCTLDSQCAEGQTCREVALCVDTYERECGHQELTVAWMDHTSLVAGPIEALLSGMLRLRKERLPQWPARTEVHMVTPGGHDIIAHAELVEETARAVVYHLELSEAAHHLLVQEAHRH